MPHADIPQLLGLLALILLTAKTLAWLAVRIGQPSVLGEMGAGVVLGLSVAGIVDPSNEVLHVLAEIGVVVLLFEIGLEIDVKNLLKVGGPAIVVAFAGITLPFALGYAVCQWLGLGQLVSIVTGAALTATSVGITARVLSDLAPYEIERAS